MTKIFFAPPAEKDFRKLPKNVQGAVKKYVALLNTDHYAGKPLHGPLRGYFVYRFSTDGISYRIAYEIIKDNIIILMINSRNNFYQKFNRRRK